MTNKDLRAYARSRNVYLWELAAKIGISEPTITRKLRTELSDSESLKMMSYIDEIAKEKNKEV